MSNKKPSGFGSSLFTLIFIVLIALFFIDKFSSIDTYFLSDDTGENGIDTEDINIYVPDSELNIKEFYYEQLNSDEKKVYDMLKAGVPEKKYTYTLTDFPTRNPKDSMRKIVWAFEHDHPEYFWIKQGYRYYTPVSGSAPGLYDLEFELMCFDYWSYSFNQQKYMKDLNHEVNKVTELAKRYFTEYDKVQFVHDYLVKNAEYDYEGLEEASKTIHDASSEYIYSAYGCLVNKKTVCAGYAKAFQLILNNMGINCYYIGGDAGGPHAWNMVRIDGKHYYFDVTWDDGFVDKNKKTIYPNDSLYNYFGLTTNEMQIDHTNDKEYFEVPLCGDTESNYFVYNNYYLDSYDEKEIKRIINEQPGKEAISIRFSNDAAYQKARKNIFKCADKAAPGQFHYLYSSDHLRILTICKKP